MHDSTAPSVGDPYNIVLFWKQNDGGLYGRRPDMLAKYLARHERVNRVFHFDAPIEWTRLRDHLHLNALGHLSHDTLIFANTLRRATGLGHGGRIEHHTFVYDGDAGRRGLFPGKAEYVAYIRAILAEARALEQRTVFWVCPKNFDWPEIRRAFTPPLVVADVIDDHRQWPASGQYRRAVQANYVEILCHSDVVLANCETVRAAMQRLAPVDIHVVPNGCEVFDGETARWERPPELRALSGPIVGYAGNLDPTRLDLDLLEHIARSRPQWHLVFIGSSHVNEKVLRLRAHPNVHFLGVKRYERALQYIRHFDVGIIPHQDNALTRSMNPLKAFVYCALDVPVVTTDIANLDELRTMVRVGRTHRAFVAHIEQCLQAPPGGIGGTDPDPAEWLRRHSWERRVTTILDRIDEAWSRLPAARRHAAPLNPSPGESDHAARRLAAAPETAPARTFAPHEYEDVCSVCGARARFRRDGYSIRETYLCPHCRSSLRYREQATVLLRLLSRRGATILAQLTHEEQVRRLRIYEPGLIGPFRQHLKRLPGYRDSFYWPDVPPGELKDGTRCEDLMALTFSDESFDLVITSDIMEHVRRPFVAFQELWRVLTVGGIHVFSIPVLDPLPPRTVFRVDTSGDVDVHVVPPHYHGAPLGGRSLVYTDFGADLVDRLRDVRFDTTIVRTRSLVAELQPMLTYYSVKVVGDGR